MSESMRERKSLLVVELWGLGDLVIATPFLQEASRRYHVTLVAKPYALDLQQRFWPQVEVVPFVAPWTAFTHKYRLLKWPWRRIFRLRELGRRRFDIGLSARSTARGGGDPRDHLLLWAFHAKQRIGFPRMGSQVFLTDPVSRPDPLSHRYENWRVLGKRIGFTLPERESLTVPVCRERHELLIHTGAGQSVRVWPLERVRSIVAHLRAEGYEVQVACDPDQLAWWTKAGEQRVVTPHSVTELLGLIDRAGAFVGNDSGPAHLAAACGVPTLTLFGPQLPEWFAPLHPRGEWIEGKACPYKPCSDYCRFAEPHCLRRVTEEEVWTRVKQFLRTVEFRTQPVSS